MTNRQFLQRLGIFYEESPSKAATIQMSDDAESLKFALLDFEFTIIDRLCLTSESDIPHVAKYLQILRASEIERSEATDTITLAEYISRLASDGVADWDEFYYSEFFQPWKRDVQPLDSDTRRVARTKFLYEVFEIFRSKSWRFDDGNPVRSSGIGTPKPHLAAYLPLYDALSDFRGSGERRYKWNVDTSKKLVPNFTKQTLNELVQRGLWNQQGSLYHAAEVSEKDGQPKPFKPRRVYFPWLVVEHEKPNKPDEDCYCRAANTANAALYRYQMTCRYGIEQDRIPPLAVVTTRGKEVRVWVMYQRNKGKIYQMDCIWNGDMSKTLDVIKFQVILENLHAWATHVLRPLISHHIDRWKYLLPAANQNLFTWNEANTTTASATENASKAQASPGKATGLAAALSGLEIGLNPKEMEEPAAFGNEGSGTSKTPPRMAGSSVSSSPFHTPPRKMGSSVSSSPFHSPPNTTRSSPSTQTRGIAPPERSSEDPYVALPSTTSAGSGTKQPESEQWSLRLGPDKESHQTVPESPL
ncbi:hypothetical protein G7046_g1695 [Stylonectria norvegica]|nr:hypothetical protein G7046_g1695 [Stylonectria norvegica]